MGSTQGVERDHCLVSSSESSAAAGILRALTAELLLESAVDKCGKVEQNNAWLAESCQAETIQKNTKTLQYQTCARGERSLARFLEGARLRKKVGVCC